jgi:ribonuclease HI
LLIGPPSSQDEAAKSGEAIWTVFCDGSWGSFGAKATAVIVSPSKVKTSYVVRLQFQSINNIAEYEALLLGLRKLKAMGVRRAVLKSDSGHLRPGG